jgi:poly-gamma-glutamate capsule biosynthesis protein CapA/YwtB (metallophosphatase superfamily)
VLLLIAADICPIGGNRPYFLSGDARSLLNDLLEEFDQADLVIGNLECPLIEQATPISKTGPVFGEPSACINGIKQAGVDVLCLANNHILDHGTAGLENTLEVCARAGIATVGAGKNLAAARRMLVKEVNGLRIGILAFAEHEFSIASNGSAGANPLDPVHFVRTVTGHRAQFDYLVVLLHGGDEFLVPTPRLQDTCRFMVEMGANAVIVQHPHVLGGCEDYRGAHIIYGQGALLMDEALYRNCPSFHEGFLVKLFVTADAPPRMEIVPFIQSSPGPGARRMEPARAQEFRRALAQRATAIKDEAWVEAEWIKFCERNKHDYLSSLLGHNRVLAGLNKRGLVEKLLHGRSALLRAKNVACCETHREAIDTIFRNRMLD